MADEVVVKPWYMSRTLWANALVIVLAVAKYYGVDSDGSSFNEEAILSVLAAINIGLRMVTKHPIK